MIESEKLGSDLKKEKSHSVNIKQNNNASLYSCWSQRFRKSTEVHMSNSWREVQLRLWFHTDCSVSPNTHSASTWHCWSDILGSFHFRLNTQMFPHPVCQWPDWWPTVSSACPQPRCLDIKLRHLKLNCRIKLFWNWTWKKNKDQKGWHYCICMLQY